MIKYFKQNTLNAEQSSEDTGYARDFQLLLRKLKYFKNLVTNCEENEADMIILKGLMTREEFNKLTKYRYAETGE
jgi:hypothetical protein